MNVQLVRATVEDSNCLYDMQVKAFMPPLKKYEDYDTSPANEPIERTLQRINYGFGMFYKIIDDGEPVGGIRILWWENTTRFRLGLIFVLPEYQGKGIAQEAIKMVENLYPHATSWELDTILQEKGNCYLYEKMGYRQIGEIKVINDRLTLVYYKKELSKI